MKKYTTPALLTTIVIVQMITMNSAITALLFVPYGIYKFIKNGEDF